MLKAKPQFVAFAPIDLKNALLYVRSGIDLNSASPTTTDIEPVGETAIALTDGALNVPDNSCVVFGNEIDEEYTVVSATRTGGTDTVFSLADGGASGGTFTYTFRGETTEPLAWNASFGDQDTAFEALCTVPAGDVAITGGTSPYTITFSGSLGDQVLTAADLTVQDYTTGGTGLALTITTPGVVPTATTAIVITPGLLTATTALGMATFKGQKIEVTIGEGNLNYKETYNREYKLNRGSLNTVKNADDTPLEISFDIEWDYISSACPLLNATIPTIPEALKGVGAAADWVNSSSDTCEPYACDIEFWNVTPCSGANVNEKYIFEDFRVEGLDANAGDSQISCTGKCNILAPEIRRY